MYTSQWKKFITYVISLTFLVLATTPLTAQAAKIDDQKVVIVLDTTHEKGTACILGAKTRSRTGLITKTEVPCPDGTLWGTKVVSRSQAIAMHELYAPLSSSASPQSIAQKAFQIRSQKKSLLLTKMTSNVLPATSCSNSNSTVYHYVDWSIDIGSGLVYRYESGIDYYVSINCNQVSLYYSDVQLYDATGSTYYTTYWGSDWYAGVNFPSNTGSSSIGSFDFVGEYYSHTVNSVQPRGYTFETSIYCPLGFRWPDIPVN